MVTDSAGATATAGVTIVVTRVAASEPPPSDYVFGGFEPPAGELAASWGEAGFRIAIKE